MLAIFSVHYLVKTFKAMIFFDVSKKKGRSWNHVLCICTEQVLVQSLYNLFRVNLIFKHVCKA